MVTASGQDERHPVERLLSAVDAPSVLANPGGEGPAIVSPRGDGPMRRLRCGDWQLFARAHTEDSAQGQSFADFRLDDGRVLTARHDAANGQVHLPFDLGEAFENYVLERWSGQAAQRRVSSRQLDVFYRVKRLIPRGAQLAARRALIRWQGLPAFPQWPYDDSVHRLVRLYVQCAALASGRSRLSFRWFWPGRTRAALMLTHDVETEAGLRGAVRVANEEQERGLRSSFNVVGRWYPIDWGIVRELVDRGFEIGVHGVFHDRSMFSSREAFEAQQPALREAAESLGATGFRSPATHRVVDWLPELPVSYDCTVPHSDPYEPQPGGCCSPWPYFIENLVELPYTLPQDHTLFTLLRHRTPEAWIQQAERLERAHGLIQCLSHPDPGYLGDDRMFASYCGFLDAMAGRASLWKPLPRDIAAWWRERDAGGPVWQGSGTYGHAECDVVSGEVAFEPPPTR